MAEFANSIMNCRLIKHLPYRTPIIREDQFPVRGLLNLELLTVTLKSSQPPKSPLP
jgi:hypothetical protein